MARVLSVAVAALLAIVAMAIPSLAVLLLFPSLWLPGLVETRLSARLDRAVEVAGAARLDLLSGEPAVEVDDLRIANPAWADERYFLRASRVRLDLSRPALLRFDIDPVAMDIHQPRLFLLRTRSGGVTWPRLGGEDGGGFDLSRLRVSDGSVIFQDLEAETDMIAKADTRDGRLTLQAEGVWAGGPMAVSLIADMTTDEDGVPVQGELVRGDLLLTAKGVMFGLPSVRGATMRVAGRGPDLAQVGVLFGLLFPSSPPFELDGHLRYEGDVWDYADVSGVIGTSDVAGRVVVRNGPQREVDVDITSRRIHLTDALIVAGVDLPAAKRAEGDVGSPRLIPDVPLPGQELAGNVILRLTLAAAEALGGPMPLGALRAHASLEGGRLVVEPLEFTMPNQGEVAGRVILSVEKGIPRLDLRGTLRKARFAVPIGGGDHAAGIVGGRFDMVGSGKSLALVLGSAQGSGAVLVSGGYLTEDILGKAGIGFDDVLGLLLPTSGEGTALHCAAATFDILNGVADVPALIVQTDSGRIEGQGRFDLGRETMDLAVRVDPAEPQLLAYSGEVGISGPWRDPGITPEMGEMVTRGVIGVGLALLAGPLAALVPFVDLGVPTESGCHKALPSLPDTPKDR